jgi:hypothetical protein
MTSMARRRSELLARAEQLAQHGFASDSDRAAFDELMSEIERLDAAESSGLITRTSADQYWPTPLSESWEEPPPPARPGPTVEHLRALRTALEKITGAGAWGYLHGHVLPRFTVEWDSPALPETKAAMMSRSHDDESLTLYLRSDLPADDHFHRICLEEVWHLVDGEWIGRWPDALLEERAARAVERLASL